MGLLFLTLICTTLIGISRRDIKSLLDDLSLVLILHNDLKPANVIRAPANTGRCTIHNRVHKWNIIDFAWVHVDEYDGNEEKKEKLSFLQKIAFHSLYWDTGSWVPT